MTGRNKPRRLVTTFLVLCIAFGCAEDHSLTEESVAKREAESEIDLIARDLDTKLYHRDLILKDAKSESQITLRVAATDEVMLQEYLKYRVFAIESIYTREESGRVIDIASSPKVLNPKSREAGDFEATVITEIVSQKLSLGAIGVKLHNRYNSDYHIDKSGRTKYLSLTTHTSNNWPSWVTYQSFDNTEMQLDYKQKWYSSWFPVYGPATWCCWDYWEFYVDGPYRVRIWVEYNFESDYFHSFIY